MTSILKIIRYWGGNEDIKKWNRSWIGRISITDAMQILLKIPMAIFMEIEQKFHNIFVNTRFSE